MSKTVQEIQSWLLSPDTIKVLLVEIVDVNTSETFEDKATIYLSSRPYISETGTNYNPCIIGGISYSESLSIDGTISVSYGDIEIDNTDGSNDPYLKYFWKNRVINIYLGDVRWNKSDFSLVFKGIVSDIFSRNRSTLNLALVDTIARLNTAITETTYQYSGSVGNIITSYKGSNVRREGLEEVLKPITFGECFNVTPVHVATGYWDNGKMYGSLYQFNNGKAERIIEVRDNGAPISYRGVTDDGCFALVYQSYGNITASVQGDISKGGYTGSANSKLFSVITNLLTNYGGDFKLSASDLDFPNYTGSNNPNVGYYCTSRENVLDICNKLASSAGYQLVNTTVTAYVGSSTNTASAGKVRLVRLDLQNVTPIYIIEDDDMVLNSLYINETIPTKSSHKINYCKNWSPQKDGLAEAINPTTTWLFKDEWIEVGYVGSSSKHDNSQTYIRDTTEPVPVESYLINEDDVNNELARRAYLYNNARYIVQATYLPHLFFAQLGDGVQFNLSDPKFSNVIAGKTGIIYSINRDWLKNTLEIGVLI